MENEILRMQDVFIGNTEPYGLDGFNLYLRSGELINIIGLSGAGKTLLYEYFMGHIPLHSGKVIFNRREFGSGVCFTGTTDVTCIGQRSTLIPGMSVAENIYIVTGKRKVRGFLRMSNIYYRAKILLSQYSPDILPDTSIWSLSAVQRRVVELLRAVENEVKLVLIDDAFSGLGQSDVQKLLELLEVLKKKKIAVVYATHEKDYIHRIADRIVVMRKGKNIRTFYETDFDEQLCKKLLIGNEDVPGFRRKNVSEKQYALEFVDVFAGKYTRHFHLVARYGEIIGLYDLNNRRNKEIIKILTGNQPVIEGQIYLNGKRYEPRDFNHAISCNIGYFSSNSGENGLINSMTFMDNLNLPVLKKTSRLKVFRERSIVRFLQDEYMTELGIPENKKDFPVEEFDESVQKKIILKRWILFKPSVMLCVEPFSGADMIMKNIIFQALDEMARNHTVVIITAQNMNELKTICDTVYVLGENSEEKIQKYNIRE